jgi:Ni/Co efflux regulator RcnB
MKSRKWMCALVVALMALSSTLTVAKEHGQGRGKQKEKHEYRYSRRDRNEMRAWYRGYRGDLPPGLAKRDRLPPGLEGQLRVRGTLPPGLRDQIRPCPEDLVRRLPPPPPDYEHVAIGGRIVLLNRQTYMVLDIFKLF